MRRTALPLTLLLLAACTQGNVFALEEGVCFDDTGPPSDGSEVAEVAEVPIVDCGAPHDNEVYATFELPDGQYPGEEQVVRLAEQGCLERFEGYVGTSYEQSELSLFTLFPTEETWTAADDREVVCAVFLDGGQLEGSVEGSGR